MITLRIPNTNIQILQQSVFLKYKALFHFVTERHHEAATEIRQTYINTMRWYFYNHFDRYHKGLVKLQVRCFVRLLRPYLLLAKLTK